MTIPPYKLAKRSDFPNPTGVPTVVRASTNSSTIATVSWSNPTYTEWDDVTVSCQPSCTNQIVHKPTSTVDITGLTPGETYTFTAVVSISGVYSSPIPNPTGVPTAMRASTDSSTIATVSWSNPNNTEWDDVTVSCQPSCTNQTVDKPTSTVDITGLTPGETYTFTAVVSINGVKSCLSQTSAPLTMTPNPTGVPTAMRASTDGSTIATVSWSNPTNTEWDDVTVSCQPFCNNQTVHKPTSTVDITGLTPGETYTFTTVVSSDGVKSGPILNPTGVPTTVRASTDSSTIVTVSWSNPTNTEWDDVTVSCQPSEGPRCSVVNIFIKPSDPTSFLASANGENITLTWDYPAGHVTSGFSLRCSPSIDGCNSIWKPVDSENSRTLSFVGANYGQTYSFMLRAVSGPAASKVYSDKASLAINLDAASPLNLENIDENIDNVTLRWNAPVNSVLHLYSLYWNATNGAPSNYADTKDSTSTTLTVSTLEPGFSYDFSVASLSYSGALSSPSNVISYTAYPSEVTGLTLQPPSHDTLIFTWNFTGRYEDFTYSLVPDTSGSQVVLVNKSDVYTLKYSSLSVDTEYNFRVGTQVQDAANASSYKSK
ncbi:receptor-type tyrosine-protein phosphatase H-like [Watersipora subatra]|uniref:receptor-type tyrosine-protein phosphatase H-like n=1 Tax=Watersipora subatra TaxID=2589382 RepID=UPI00355C3D25